MLVKLKIILIRFQQIVELWREKGFATAMKFTLYTEGKAIPVVKDLRSLETSIDCFSSGSLDLVEITDEEGGARQFNYLVKSRELKSQFNMKKGFRSFALVDAGNVIADVWYVTTTSSKLGNIHSDLDLLGITLSDKDVYLFDVYVAPGRRGKEIATRFMGCVLQKLKEKGFARAYGYFMADNIPALWFHRLLGYRELPPLLLKRVFIFQNSRKIETDHVE